MSRLATPESINEDDRLAETYEMLVRNIYGWCRVIKPIAPTDRMQIDIVRRHYRPWGHVLEAYSAAHEVDTIRIYPHGERYVVPYTEWGLLGAIEYEQRMFPEGERDRDHIGTCSHYLSKLRNRAKEEAADERERREQAADTEGDNHE